ncbi:MAG: HAMP domain-containing sensor histidine kinase [Pseudomonadota bacterium]
MLATHMHRGGQAGSGSNLDEYLGNLSVALVRAKAERDIRNAQVAADAAIRVRSSFLENMNHELRTPLNAIIGFAGMLQQGATYDLSEDQRQSYAEYIQQSADLLLVHINTILETAALDNGSVTPIQEAVDLVDLVNTAINQVGVQARAKTVQIRCVCGTDKATSAAVAASLSKAWIDAERMGQAMHHLLVTAIKSCEQGSKILVCIQPKGDAMLSIQIRDNGRGFSDSEVQDALAAFGHTNRGLNKPFDGPGVGLAIAKTFIEMQGGTFAIRSRKDKGTLITIAVPVAEAIEVTGMTDDDQSLEALMDEQPTTDLETEALAKSA